MDWLLSRLKFIDEAGVNLSLTRLYGRAFKGERVVGFVPKNRGENVTMLGCLSLCGLSSLMTVNGAADGEVFLIFIRDFLCPTLEEGDIVVLDNYSIHKGDRIKKLIEGCGARLVFLPPYSPDLNPIEKCWSKLKTLLRGFGARTRETLEAAITKAMTAITEKDAKAWFEFCGYKTNSFAN